MRVNYQTKKDKMGRTLYLIDGKYMSKTEAGKRYNIARHTVATRIELGLPLWVRKTDVYVEAGPLAGQWLPRVEIERFYDRSNNWVDYRTKIVDGIAVFNPGEITADRRTKAYQRLNEQARVSESSETLVKANLAAAKQGPMAAWR